MGRIAAWLRSLEAATVDTVITVIALLVVLIPTVAAALDLAGGSPDGAPFQLGLLVLALALAFPFVNRVFSPDWLGSYVLAFWGGVLGFGVAGGVVVALSGISLSGENPLWPALLVALGHASALATVGLHDVRLRSPQFHPSNDER
jgi:hypothetical protein